LAIDKEDTVIILRFARNEVWMLKTRTNLLPFSLYISHSTQPNVSSCQTERLVKSTDNPVKVLLQVLDIALDEKIF